MTIEKLSYLLADVKKSVLECRNKSEHKDAVDYADGQLSIIEWVENTLKSE